MNIIFSAITSIIILLLFASLSALLYGIWRKDNEKFIQKTADKVSSIIDSKMEEALDEHKAGPWYLVVYTKDSNYPIWISHNTIRSIHPDPKNCKLIIKQFNGEGVIDNVESYELCSASDLCEYDM